MLIENCPVGLENGGAGLVYDNAERASYFPKLWEFFRATRQGGFPRIWKQPTEARMRITSRLP